MSDTPLVPFSPPEIFRDFALLPSTTGVVMQWIFYFAIIFWFIYTLVAIYHWIKYSHAAVVAIPSIALHVGVSLLLIVYALTGAFFV
jgi:hypothetical protein